MKAVMFSIKPFWCGRIAQDEKTVEVRKRFSEMKTPFKCYIYCTKDKHGGIASFQKPDGGYIFSNGHVIADFICDRIIDIGVPYPAWSAEMNQDILKAACMSYSEMHSYAGHDTVYGLHISDLHIFDHSKSLDKYGMIRPPQSWCYVYSDDDGRIL